MSSSTSLPVFRRALGDSWRALIGWSLGLAAALFLYLPLYSTLGGRDSQMSKLISQLPPQLVNTLGYQDIASGPGYVEATFFGLIGFLVITIASVSWGTAAIAGDEENGSLELTLAHGVSRQQVVLERALAVLVRLLWLTVFSGLIILALNGSAQLELQFGNLVATLAAYLGLALLSSLFGLAVGALTGRRAYATVAGAGIAILGYVLNALGSQNESLSGLRAYSPYGWAFRHTPLADGADWGGLALLYGFSVLFVVLAVVGLRRRDIGG